MTIFSIMGPLFDDEQRLTELDRIAVLGHDRGDATGRSASICFIIFMAR